MATMMQFEKLIDCPHEQLAGRRVFIRADVNVPQDDACNITDDTRIRAALERFRPDCPVDAGRFARGTALCGRTDGIIPRISNS
jgi:phosphoglycerate kinase